MGAELIVIIIALALGCIVAFIGHINYKAGYEQGWKHAEQTHSEEYGD